jgi:hypothetical protein
VDESAVELTVTDNARRALLLRAAGRRLSSANDATDVLGITVTDTPSIQVIRGDVDEGKGDSASSSGMSTMVGIAVGGGGGVLILVAAWYILRGWRSRRTTSTRVGDHQPQPAAPAPFPPKKDASA